jgi:hypothetical protein
MLPRKDKRMNVNSGNSDLRDRIITLEKELKRTQKLVQEDMQKLFKLIQETQKGGN